MNDDELMTAVRDSFTGVHSATSVEQIVRRSRTVRTRRRIASMVGGLAVTVAGAIAVTTLLVGHQPGRPATAQLAAWTVTKHADGSITVTFRELRDLAGLQRMLRADGVPASVTLFGKQNPTCRPYPPGQPRSETRRQTIIIATLGGKGPSNLVISSAFTSNSVIIDPSALPSGVGLQIGAGPVRSLGGGPEFFPIWAGLVRTSPHCTGS